MIRSSKDIRNIVAAFLLFIYGSVLIPTFLISFQSGAHGINLIPIMIFVLLFAFGAAILFYYFKIKIRFPFRMLIYILLLSGINMILWVTICEGTFIFRD